MGLFSEAALKDIEVEENHLEKRTILIVDDEAYNLTTLEDALHDNYDVLTAADGQEALELLQKDSDPTRIHLIISDQRMPNMTGVEFLRNSIEIIPQTIRIILTGFTDVEAIMDSINQAQIYKFILKPFDKQDILLTIKRGLEVYDLEEKNRNLMEALTFLNGRFFNHMRGILQGIAGSTELLQQNPSAALPPGHAQLLKNMGQSTNNLIHLLNKASDLSFVYTGNRPARKEQLDIVALIQEQGENFVADKSPDELTIIYEWSPDVGDGQGRYYVEADHELFCKALWELLENAFTYSNKPTKITIRTFIQNNQLRIHVQDQGIGLENEGGASLMMPFVRGENSDDYKPFGFGMGLAQAKAYIEAQDGELTFSQESSGTSVSLHLPLPVYESESDLYLENPSQRILIFQENTEDLTLYQEVLEFEGHNVLALKNMEGVMESAADWQPNLIFLDAHHQSESTAPAIEQLRQIPSLATTPIVVVAPDPELKNRQTYLESGAQEYVSQPMEYEQLIMLIHQLT